MFCDAIYIGIDPAPPANYRRPNGSLDLVALGPVTARGAGVRRQAAPARPPVAPPNQRLMENAMPCLSPPPPGSLGGSGRMPAAVTLTPDLRR
jgi:hypothetical protein